MNTPLENEIAKRFGVLPNFFGLASSDPQITANLWGFARFAYLDNPLPSLFKERLFVYLFRFCEVRYCIARHVGFLTGLPGRRFLLPPADRRIDCDFAPPPASARGKTSGALRSLFGV